MKKIENIDDLKKIVGEKNIETDKTNLSFTITEEIEAFDKLKTKVLKYIMYKKRTEADIRKKFVDENQDMLEEAIEYFKELKYIDDYSYIERTISEYISLKNLSRKELKYKLLSKGIDKKQLEDYFLENSEKLEEYEINSAQQIILKKIKKDEIEKIKNYLYQKGFTSDTINIALDDLNNE